MEAYRFEKKIEGRKEKPLVISVKNSKKGMTLVLAVMGYQREKSTRNNFKLRFNEALARSGVQAKHDSFTTGMIEISNLDWKQFMDDLRQID